MFLDGAAVAGDFRAEHPAEFDLLAAHRILFFYDHDSFDWRAHQHVIELDVTGAVSGVTIAQHMADICDLPQERGWMITIRRSASFCARSTTPGTSTASA